MRAAIAGLAAGLLLLGIPAGLAADRLPPALIQSTFFTGQPFTAATLANVKFKMTFTPDGKVTREPAAGGAKVEGTWKLSKEGFCSTWKGSQQNCFVVMPSGENKWSVIKGTTAIATWTK